MTPSSHEEIDFCSQIVQMGLQRLWRVDHGKTGVFVALLFIVFGTEIVEVCKCFVRIDNY